MAKLPVKYALWLLLLLFIVIGTIFVYRISRTITPVNEDNLAVIIEVIDGDTYKVRFRGKEEKLRLIGIDTPETQANRKAHKNAEEQNQSLESIREMGDHARAYVRTLIPPGTRLRLEFDMQIRDRYDRLLAYAYLENGEMLNEKIIAEGYASPMTYPPNIRHQQNFLSLYQKARLQKKGLWKTHEK